MSWYTFALTILFFLISGSVYSGTQHTEDLSDEEYSLVYKRETHAPQSFKQKWSFIEKNDFYADEFVRRAMLHDSIKEGYNRVIVNVSEGEDVEVFSVLPDRFKEDVEDYTSGDRSERGFRDTGLQESTGLREKTFNAQSELEGAEQELTVSERRDKKDIPLKNDLFELFSNRKVQVSIQADLRKSQTISCSNLEGKPITRIMLYENSWVPETPGAEELFLNLDLKKQFLLTVVSDKKCQWYNPWCSDDFEVVSLFEISPDSLAELLLNMSDITHQVLEFGTNFAEFATRWQEDVANASEEGMAALERGNGFHSDFFNSTIFHEIILNGVLDLRVPEEWQYLLASLPDHDHPETQVVCHKTLSDRLMEKSTDIQEILAAQPELVNDPSIFVNVCGFNTHHTPFQKKAMLKFDELQMSYCELNQCKENQFQKFENIQGYHFSTVNETLLRMKQKKIYHLHPETQEKKNFNRHLECLVPIRRFQP